jgi:hypothetical protein
MQVQVLGFDVVKELYKDDPDFGYAWKECSNVLTTISCCKMVFFSKTTIYAFPNVHQEKPLSKKPMEEALLVILAGTKL